MKTYTEQDLRDALGTLAPAESVQMDMWPGLRSRIRRRRRANAALAAGVIAAATVLAAVDWPGSAPDRVSPVTSGGTSALTMTLGGSLPRGVTMGTIVNVLRARLDELGVSGSQIVVHGVNIVVTVPTTEAGQLRDLNARGQVQLRQVLEMTAVSSGVEAIRGGVVGAARDLNHAEAVFSRSLCTTASGKLPLGGLTASANSFLVGCSPDGTSEYLLGSSTISNDEVASAHAVASPTTNQWVVDVTLNHAGAAAWQQLTATAVHQPMAPQCQPPGGCNAIGMLVDSQIITVPSVQSGNDGISNGELEIAPAGTQAEARALAVKIAHPLPVPLLALSLKNSG